MLRKRPCQWTTARHTSYRTECGKQFHDATETGSPVTDWLQFCPYCGNKVTVKDSAAEVPNGGA